MNQRSIDNPFHLGGRYHTREGFFTVVALERENIRIRWDTGQEMIDTIASQARILRNMQRDANPTPARSHDRPSSTPHVIPTGSMAGLYKFSIYTIRQSGVLAAECKRGGAGKFIENKRWTSALGFLEHGRKARQRLPLMFAAGERIRGIIYSAYIDDLFVSPLDERGSGTTEIRFSGLQPLRPKRPLSALILRSSGAPLSDDFIKPYAICHTPDFLPTRDATRMKQGK